MSNEKDVGNTQVQEVILHIGLHRTGSSSIQAWLNDNQKQLLQRGIHYPLGGRHGHVREAHHLLSHGICEQSGADWGDEWRRVLHEIAIQSAPRIVISSEGFALSNEQQIAEIGRQLKPFNVTVIVYIRNSLSLMISRYKQQIKTGKIHQTAREFFADRCGYCDFSELVTKWAFVFGGRNVHIRLFDKVCETSGVINDFVHFVDPCKSYLADSIPETYLNASPSDSVLVTLRVLNRLALPRAAKIRRHIIKNTVAGRLAMAALNPFCSRKFILPGEIEFLRDQLRPFNEVFCSQFIDRVDHHFLALD